MFQGKLGSYDLYTCHDSFLARYGDDGPEYLSSMTLSTFIEAVNHSPWDNTLMDGLVREGQGPKPCPGCAEPCGQCNQEALD